MPGSVGTAVVTLYNPLVSFAIVSPAGNFLEERVRIETPSDCPPAKMVALLVKLVKPLGAFDCVTIGFPGMIKRGHVISAPNLGTERWRGFALEIDPKRRISRETTR